MVASIKGHTRTHDCTRKMEQQRADRGRYRRRQRGQRGHGRRQNILNKIRATLV